MKSKIKEGSVALVAFGGNAFSIENDSYTIENQRAAASIMCEKLLTVVEKGYDLVITHGNGPQVGNLMLQRDLTKKKVAPMPLDVLVAQTEGSLGYILHLNAPAAIQVQIKRSV